MNYFFLNEITKNLRQDNITTYFTNKTLQIGLLFG